MRGQRGQTGAGLPSATAGKAVVHYRCSLQDYPKGAQCAPVRDRAVERPRPYSTARNTFLGPSQLAHLNPANVTWPQGPVRVQLQVVHRIRGPCEHGRALLVP